MWCEVLSLEIIYSIVYGHDHVCIRTLNQCSPKQCWANCNSDSRNAADSALVCRHYAEYGSTHSIKRWKYVFIYVAWWQQSRRYDKSAMPVRVLRLWNTTWALRVRQLSPAWWADSRSSARIVRLPTRELLVPGEDELLSHYRSTIGCRFIRQCYTASAEPHSAAP